MRNQSHNSRKVFISVVASLLAVIAHFKSYVGPVYSSASIDVPFIYVYTLYTIHYVLAVCMCSWSQRIALYNSNSSSNKSSSSVAVTVSSSRDHGRYHYLLSRQPALVTAVLLPRMRLQVSLTNTMCIQYCTHLKGTIFSYSCIAVTVHCSVHKFDCRWHQQLALMEFCASACVHRLNCSMRMRCVHCVLQLQCSAA
jgi:hypothetical protein